MISPEKNDVDISKLFSWGKQASIYDSSGNVVLNFYIRIVGDAELNQARVYGLRKSAELRKKLKTPNSDEALAYIADIDVLEIDQLVSYILTMRMKEITQEVIPNLEIPFPKEISSDASLEEQEQYQKLVDDFPTLVQKKIEEAVTPKVEAEKNKLNTIDKISLYHIYVDNVIKELCELEMYNNFREKCAYFGSFKDPEYQDRLFNKFEDFNNLVREVKDQFVEIYNDLEMNMDDLKKLPGVTLSQASGE